MPNPYLSAAFNYNDYGLTVFEPDMVLTHDQLNTVFGFLMGQEMRTRTRLIGIGVVCGLEVRIGAGNTILLSKGCGVTSEGDLLCIESDKTYTGFRAYNLTEHAPYAPFSAIAGFQAWELFPSEFSATEIPTPLSSLSLSDKVALLYLESEVKNADNCTGVDCDNKGDVFNNRLHILLVRRTDADKLIEKTHIEAALACTRLPRPVARRVRLDDRTYEVSLRNFRVFINNTVNSFINHLNQSYNLVSNILNPIYGGASPIPAWEKILRQKATANSTDAKIQYVYDWLKDLYDAYEEFRETTCHCLTECMPLESSFPKHLLIGELVPSNGQCKTPFRHYFKRSPAITCGTEGWAKAVWLHQRIGQLIDMFEIPATGVIDLNAAPTRPNLGLTANIATHIVTPTLGSSTSAGLTTNILNVGRLNPAILAGRGFDFRAALLSFLNIEITPDHYRIHGYALSRRSMPYYYRPDMRNFWSYEKAKRCQTRLILSYHNPTGSVPDEVNNPFNYNIENYNFYRIEGFIGANALSVLNNVLRLRSQYNLAFDVVALRADAFQFLISDGTTFNFSDLQIDFDDILSQIRCEEAEIPRFPSPLNITLSADTAGFDKLLLAYQTQLTRLRPNHPSQVACIQSKLPLLTRLNREYHRRRTEFEANQTFGNFLLAHPGMEHGAGVPRGGTFILVYKNNPTRGQERNSIVVADYYLPYRCCSKAPSVKFVLPEPPPTITLDKTRFCLNEPRSRIQVTPIGGSFGANTMVSRVGTDFYFTPSVVGTHTLIYTLADGRSAQFMVEVVALPVAAFQFTFDRERQGMVNFLNFSTGATEVVWDFGDGSPRQTIRITSAANGNVAHQYRFDPERGATFNAVLTSNNGACNSEPFSQVVRFTAAVRPRLEVAPLICFGRTQIRATGTPAGGAYASNSLTINANTGGFAPIRPGTHRITYTLDGQVAEATIFILPVNFKIENARREPNRRRAVVEVIVLTPPADLTYVWFFNDREVKSFEEKVEGADTRYSLALPIDIQGGGITLVFRRGDAELCDKIVQGFEIRQ